MLKKQKGITLIALIITIIVMLILVGVTVTLIVESGVFNKAKKAAKETERSLIEELIISSYVFEELASNNTSICLDMYKTSHSLYQALTSAKFKLEDSEGNLLDTPEAFLNSNGGELIQEINLNVIGKYGRYTGKITKHGLQGRITISDKDNPKVDSDLQKLKLYFEGNYIVNTDDLDNSLLDMTIFNPEDPTTYQFKGNKTITEASTKINILVDLLPQNAPPDKIYITYNNKIYEVTCSYNELSSGGMALQAINVLPRANVNTDNLEGLQALVGKNLTDEQIKEKVATIENLTINFEGYKLFDTDTEFLVPITYNEEKYTLYVTDEDGTYNITSVLPKLNDNFHFGGYYINEEAAGAYQFMENGDAKVYRLNGQLAAAQPNIAIIYQDKVYFNEDNFNYSFTGSVKEVGNILAINEDSSDEMIFTYDPDFADKIKELEELMEGIFGYYETTQQSDGQTSTLGYMIENNSFCYMCVGMGENRLAPFPIVEMYLELEPFEATLKDGTKKVIEYPIYSKAWDGSVSIFGYVKKDQLITVKVNQDYNTKEYISITDDQILNKKDFPCDKLSFDSIYKTTTSENSTYKLIGINESTKTIDLGQNFLDKNFWNIGPSKFFTKNDFIAELTDGTIIEDYKGKQVIFYQHIDTENNTVKENQYDLFGYIDGDNIITFKANVAERDSDGIPTKYDSITLETNGVYSKQ